MEPEIENKRTQKWRQNAAENSGFMEQVAYSHGNSLKILYIFGKKESLFPCDGGSGYSLMGCFKYEGREP